MLKTKSAFNKQKMHSRRNAFFVRIKKPLPLFISILLMTTLFLSLSPIVFSETRYWIGNNANLSIDSDNTLFIDLTNNLVGIGNVQPNVTLHVSGAANITGKLTVGSGLNLTGGLRVSELAACDTLNTDAAGNLLCGADASGGALPWNSSGARVYLGDLKTKNAFLWNAFFVIPFDYSIVSFEFDSRNIKRFV